MCFILLQKLLYGNAEAESTVSEARMLKDGAEGEPIFAAKIGLLEEAFFFGGEKFLAPGLVKLFGKRAREALEVPMIMAELSHEHEAAELRENSPLGEEGFDFGVFADDEVGFGRVVDGRVGVVDAIVNEMVGSEDDAASESPDFEVKTSVLVRRARSGEEIDGLVFEEFAAVDGRPDGRSESEKGAASGGAWRDEGFEGRNF